MQNSLNLNKSDNWAQNYGLSRESDRFTFSGGIVPQECFPEFMKIEKLDQEHNSISKI